jgi:phenylalanyl-tRNA synthetase beta chain
MDYFDLKGVVEALLSRLDLEPLGSAGVQWTRGKHPSFHPGRCAKVGLDDKDLGYIGELHPLVGEAFDMPEQPIVLMEWDLDVLLEAARAAEAEKKLGWVSTYPQVHEDLALVVDESVPALEVQRALLEIGAPLVTRVLLFDTYRGPQVGQGRKSLAFALTYQAPDRPLRDRDVEKLRKRLIKRIEQQVGATLRGPQ